MHAMSIVIKPKVTFALYQTTKETLFLWYRILLRICDSSSSKYLTVFNDVPDLMNPSY